MRRHPICLHGFQGLSKKGVLIEVPCNVWQIGPWLDFKPGFRSKPTDKHHRKHIKSPHIVLLKVNCEFMPDFVFRVSRQGMATEIVHLQVYILMRCFAHFEPYWN